MSKAAHTTNYSNVFISVAEDCPATSGEVPPERGGKPTVAGLQYAMIADSPYKHTSDEIVFATSAVGRALNAKASKAERQAKWDQFFSKGQACLRASSLGKKFGWGIHSDERGRVAIYAVGSSEYESLAGDINLRQLKAMRSKRG
ncbi:MAG: hypothetical protein K0U74_15325 [Alphaproteobacteria bacterium]|nr:hypothetical protein [Alphaproteobacteria bacterium]